MKVTRQFNVPTGIILTALDEKGRGVECLGVQDYGKGANLKADFLGLTENIQEVKHQDLMSTSDKLVVTISSQNGCSMGCVFCDVPKVGKGTNVSLETLHAQTDTVLTLYPDLEKGERLNIHYARMGEPTFNKAVLQHAREVKGLYEDRFTTVHPVVSTMMPRKNKELKKYLGQWMDIKNNLYKGEAGLQLSINSTNDTERDLMFSGASLPFNEVGAIAKNLANNSAPVGRKITLNFALAGYEIDENKLLEWFNPEYFLCKLTPMHVTESVVDNEVSFIEPYEEVEERLKKVGYDVIVFIPSHEEDMGRITCGNALLSGSLPEVRYEQIIHKNLC